MQHRVSRPLRRRCSVTMPGRGLSSCQGVLLLQTLSSSTPLCFHFRLLKTSSWVPEQLPLSCAPPGRSRSPSPLSLLRPGTSSQTPRAPQLPTSLRHVSAPSPRSQAQLFLRFCSTRPPGSPCNRGNSRSSSPVLTKDSLCKAAGSRKWPLRGWFHGAGAGG